MAVALVDTIPPKLPVPVTFEVVCSLTGMPKLPLPVYGAKFVLLASVTVEFPELTLDVCELLLGTG